MDGVIVFILILILVLLAVPAGGSNEGFNFRAQLYSQTTSENCKPCPKKDCTCPNAFDSRRFFQYN
jgi:hypothetical protein